MAMKRNLKPSICKDNSCRKRIKVRDLDCDGPSTCRSDASPMSLKERHAAYANNAKTSEFAFFKKFKEDANLRFSSSLPHQKELRSKKFNSSDRFRESVSPVQNHRKDFTSHHLVENVTPVSFNSMHLPLGNSSRISEVDVKHAHKTLEDIQRNVKNDESFTLKREMDSHDDSILNQLLVRHPIPEINQNNIFSRKREKLRQFTQNMKFHGTGESNEKGYGVISSLLSRLIPGSNQYKFNNNLEKQVRPQTCFPRLDYEHHLNDSSSPSRLNKSRGDFSHSEFPTNSNDDNFHVKYRTKESDSELEGKMILLDVNGSPSTAAVENYRPLISSLFKPQSGLYDQGEPLYLRKQEPEPLLLGWDIDNIKDESSSFQLTKLNMFSEPPISFVDDHRPNLHMSFGAIARCSSPFPSNKQRNLYSLPYSSLASYQIHGLSRHDIEKEENIDQCDNYFDDRGSRDFFCAQNARWLMNNVLDDGREHSSVESLCASGVVFDFGWKFLSGSEEQCQTAYRMLKFPLDEMRPAAPVNEECSNSSSDGVLVEYQPPFFFQPESFFEDGKACSLLTDKLSWDAARGEINVEITEMDYI